MLKILVIGIVDKMHTCRWACPITLGHNNTSTQTMLNIALYGKIEGKYAQPIFTIIVKS